MNDNNLIVTTRQITGQPYRYYGYVRDRAEKKLYPCGHAHNRRKGVSGRIYAERCAGKLLRKMRRATK